MSSAKPRPGGGWVTKTNPETGQRVRVRVVDHPGRGRIVIVKPI